MEEPHHNQVGAESVWVSDYSGMIVIRKAHDPLSVTVANTSIEPDWKRFTSGGCAHVVN